MIFKLENLSFERKLDIALRAVNFFQPSTKQLTDLEINLVTLIGLLPDKFKYAPFSQPAKKYLRNQALEKYAWVISPVNLNNKLYSLRDKGLIHHDTDGVMYLTPIFAQMLKEIKTTHHDNKPWELSFSFPQRKMSTSQTPNTGAEERQKGESKEN